MYKSASRLSLILIGCASLAACTHTSVGLPEEVTVVPANIAQHCIPKGNVYSEAPFFGVFAGTTEEKLLDLAKESAGRLGANALVLDEPTQQEKKYTLTGKAYSCQ